VAIEEIRIRRAVADDAAVMQAFWEASAAETTATPYPGAPFEESLLTDHVALLAVYANIRSGDFGFVFGLYVRPDRRRQGVARALMRAVAEKIAAEGKDYVVLSVDTPNEAARTLYDRLGFVDAARTLRTEVSALLRTP
jgi:ribosomal protein S18 acetylase RimI-like enzyme